MDLMAGFGILINSVSCIFMLKLNKIIPTESVHNACKAWAILLIVLLKQCTFPIRKKSLVHIFVFLQIWISVCGQPLDRPPEGFPCGTAYCTRWGFDTCITSSSKPYCLPCDHDQLPRHCGTKDEYPGCSLYCADLSTNGLKTKLEETMAMMKRLESNLSSMAQKLNTTAQNLTMTTLELHKAEENLTETAQKLQVTMLNVTITTQLLHHAEQNVTDMSQRLQQTRLNLSRTEQALTRTEIELHSCEKEKDGLHQMNTALQIVTVGVCLVSVLMIVVCKVRREKRPRKDVETSDGETSEETSLMTDTASDSSVNSIQKTPKSDNTSNSRITCNGDELCYGKQKLTNVQPTNARGKSELAVLQLPNPNVGNDPNPSSI